MGFMQKGVKGKNTDVVEESAVDEMFRAGVHYGYQRSRRHPSVAPYIYATKNKSDIINLEKTAIQLKEASEFMRGLGARGKMVLFVGTKPEAKNIAKDSAESLNMPYVTERWIGGTISNYAEIKRGIEELENYRKDMSTGGLEKYTKKERVMMAKKMERVTKYYEGLLRLKRLPDALCIIDAKSDDIALAEARQLGIPVVALVNSDTDIKNINHPVVGNDASIPSINFFLQAMIKSYKEGELTLPAKTEQKEGVKTK